jgi:hypothetical protein
MALGAKLNLKERPVLSQPPGIDGLLTVGAEHGDILLQVELAGRPFCALVLTTENALSISMWLTAHVVDDRKRRQAGEPC